MDSTLRAVIADANALWEYYSSAFTSDEQQAVWSRAYATHTHILECIRAVAIAR